MKLSTRQNYAIDWDNNRELLVSAAAGSGKTTVLVQRIINRIINKRIPTDSFLIVTFTHASATELKEKVTKALDEKLKECPDDEWLAVQSANISRAAIGTMHAFCLRVLKENHEHPAIKLPKVFKILSNDKQTELFDAAMDDVFAYEYEKNEDSFIALLDKFASYKDDKELRTLVKEVYSFAINSVDPEKWFDDGATASGGENVKDKLAELISAEAEELAGVCRYTLENTFTEKKTHFDDDLVTLQGLLSDYAKALSEKDYESAEKIYASVPKITMVGNFKDEVVVFRKKTVQYVVDRLARLSLGTGMNGNNMTFELSKLVDVAREVYEAYSAKKQRQRAVDYNDMEHKVLKLFDDESVASLYCEKFSHILFDEYQDCNRVQEAIMQKICKKAHYFMVGDIKQSIYSFRQADPSLFLEKYNRYEFREDAEFAKIELNENYRSRKNVLNAANYIFFNVMKKKFCGMDYNVENALNARLEYPATELDTFENDPVSVAAVRRSGNKGQTLHSELLYVINEIKKIVGKKYVYDTHDEGYRPLSYGDIAIIMRAPGSSQKKLTEYLMKANIPFVFKKDSDMSFSPEINLIISLLRAIEDPYDDISVMSVLHSYIFDVTDVEMSKLMNSGLTEEKSVIDKIDAYINAKDNDTVKLDTALLSKLERFNGTFEKWIKKQEYMSASEFIDELIDETAYMEYFGAFKNGEARVNNINLFLASVRARLNAYQGGLFECAAMLDGIDKNGFNGESENGGENVVSIMSIHKSKGLEFPVVFILRCGKEFNKNDYSSTVLIHKDHGITAKLIDAEKKIEYDSADYNNMALLLKKEQREEELRDLYVAMTRAREKLYIVGTTASSEKCLCMASTLADIANVSKYFEWILPLLRRREAMPVSYPLELEALDGRTLSYSVPGTDYTSTWKLNLVLQNEAEDGTKCIIGGENKTLSQFAEKEEALSDDAPALPDTDITDAEADAIIEKLSYEYPHAEATRLNSKLSVSQIKRILEERELSEDDEVPLYRKETVRVIATDEVMTSARLGTLYHFFMQHLTVKRPYEKEDFEKDVSLMLERRLITEYESGYLKYEKFKAFFEGEVGARTALAEKVEREKNFSYMLDAKEVYPDTLSDEKILIQGVIDCLVKTEDGKYILIDYKTDKVAPADEEILITRHKKQIELYCLAVEDIENIVISEKYIYSFALEKFIEVK